MLQKLITDHQTIELLSRVGESLELEEEVRSDMKALVLSKVHAENVVTCGQPITKLDSRITDSGHFENFAFKKVSPHFQEGHGG